MAQDILSLAETLASPNDFAAGFRLAEELAKVRLRLVAARILTAVMNADDEKARQEIIKLVEELRADELSLTDLQIILPSAATPPLDDPPADNPPADNPPAADPPAT